MTNNNATIPKVSIITATFNAELTLPHCIDSIADQTYPRLEHIIIDGASTDDTLSIIKNNIDKIAYWVSEPDDGISDAFNKGIRAARGDYIYFLGADDELCSPTSIADIFDHLETDEYDIICGKIIRTSEDGKKELWRSTTNFSKKSLLFRMSLPHQGTFTHKRFFEKYGLFRSDIKYSMDYELLLRAYKTFPKVLMVDEFVAYWRAGGIGNGKLLEVFKEYHQIKCEHQVASPLLLKLINKWILFKFFIRQNILNKLGIWS